MTTADVPPCALICSLCWKKNRFWFGFFCTWFKENNVNLSMEGRELWMWQQCRSKGCRVILEDFPEGGFISTSPGSLPVPARESIMLWWSCRAEAGHGTSSHTALVPSISPWPQERAATHVFLPSGGRANTALCFHARILKGQRLLRVKTLEWIEREHDVQNRYKSEQVLQREQHVSATVEEVIQGRQGG